MEPEYVELINDEVQNHEEQEYLVVTEELATEAQIYDIDEQNEAKSIEINIEIIKTIFMNFLNLYEALMLKNCHSCNIISSKEFVEVHNNFVDIDGLLKVFDLSFDKTVLENFIKKAPNKSPIRSSKDKKDRTLHNCLISACTKQYSSFESVQVHFIKSHCCPIQCFEPKQNSSDENEKIDFSKIPKDSDGQYICQLDEYCHYTTSDRSNFRVHCERHRMAKRFYCFICNKYFTAKEPLIIHFCRVHFLSVPWHLVGSDIRLVRKTIRKLTTPDIIDLDIDQIPDIEEDLTGPETLQNLEISAYISQAINHGTVTRGDICTATKNDEIIDETSEDVNESHTTEEVIVNEKKRTHSETQNQTKDDSPDNEEKVYENIVEEAKVGEPSIKKLKIRPKNFQCVHEFCLQDFYSKKGLLVHLKSNHDPGNKFVCDHDGCLSRFQNPTLLAQHKRRHNCQLQCEHCEYRTHLNAQMEKHIRLHTGEEMPHVCPECSQRFTFLGQMANHRKKEHKIIESFACDSPNCEKIFKTMVGLNKHKRELHMNIRNNIPCEWANCDSVFTNNSSYQKHLRIHNNERPILCEYPGCGKSFRLKETMVRHLKIHEGSTVSGPVEEEYEETVWTEQ